MLILTFMVMFVLCMLAYRVGYTHAAREIDGDRDESYQRGYRDGMSDGYYAHYPDVQEKQQRYLFEARLKFHGQN